MVPNGMQQDFSAGLVGLKGVHFLDGLLRTHLYPARIYTYPQKGDESGALDKLLDLADKHQISVQQTTRPLFGDETLIFLVGWQYILTSGTERCVVFHDSTLPQSRGFSPTVTALLVGSEQLGVTALRPDEGMDTGPVLGQRQMPVRYPITIERALQLQVELMVDLACEILAKSRRNELSSSLQSGSATYSIWRDEYDYFIDWRKSAEEIRRHVDAVGYPYPGAKGFLGTELITIDEIEPGPNMQFEIRDPGKLWQIADTRALVVCGSGTAWIKKARDRQGYSYRFQRLRARFLTPDNAWLALSQHAQS